MKKSTIMFTIAIIILGMLLMFFFFKTLQEGNRCIGNPLTYGADMLSSELTGSLSCNCYFENADYKGIYFDKENVSVLNDYYSYRGNISVE